MIAEQKAFWRDPLFYLAIGAGVIFWGLLYGWVKPPTDAGWPLRAPLRFLTVALLYPVIEEIVFRGLLQELIHQRLKPWRLGPLTHANILTSLLFTALHFFSHPPFWALAVLAPSLLFGLFKDRTGGLAAPIALHVFYNGGYFWIFAQ